MTMIPFQWDREPVWIWAEDEDDKWWQKDSKEKNMAAFKKAMSEIIEQSQIKAHGSWIAKPKEGTGVEGQECVNIYNSEPLSFDTRRCDSWMKSFICELSND